MFGGEGLYAGDLIIGLVIRERIHLKTGDADRAAYLAEGCEPFSFMRGKKRMTTSYYVVPDRLLDDPEDSRPGRGRRRLPRFAAKAPPSKPRSRKR